MMHVLNRKLQDYLRPKRLTIGRFFWDKKIKKINIFKENIIEKNKVKSILFLRYDGKIGDMVINTMLFREIKKQYPKIRIGIVSRGGATDVILHNKYVDKIYNYSKKRKNIKILANEISKDSYDLLIDFSTLLKVNQMMFINLCNARINLGVEKQEWKLFDLSIDEIDYSKHISYFYIKLLKKLGIKNIDESYDIQLSNDEEKIGIFLQNKNEKGYMIFNPYAASKHRSFNVEKSIDIGKVLLKKRQESLILIGTEDHMEDLLKIQKTLGDRVFIPKLNGILEVASIIKNSKLVVTPDTSIIHIAVAYDRNIIGIYRKEKGDQNSLLWGPNSKKAKVIFVEEDVKKGEEVNINKLNINQIREVL